MKLMTKFCVVLLLVSVLAGCSKKIPELGLVNGAVTLNGKKLDGIRVEFLPDPEKGNMAESSFGESDAEGNFSLSFSGKDNTPGAAVGQHRVVLWDYVAMNTRDADAMPSRISDKFNLAARTPILLEVKPGQQTIDIELDKYK